VSVRITGVEAVLDPWIERTDTPTRCNAVLHAIADAADHYDELFGEQALVGDHPLVRWIDVPEGDASVRVLLPHPHKGIHILQIFDFTGIEDL